jgi:hypothetical protein
VRLCYYAASCEGPTAVLGYIGLAVLVLLWASPGIRPAVIVALSAAVTFYFLFQAPVWCGAVTRYGTLCRRNSSGLLMGCSYRQHKWQRVRMTVVPHAWRYLTEGLWDDPKTRLTAVATVLTIISLVVGLVRIPFS